MGEGTTIEAILAAAGGELAVESAMATLAESLGAASAGITFWRNDTFVGQYWAPLPPGFVQDYTAHFHASDPWKEQSRKLSVGALCASDAIVPRGLLERTPFFNDLCRPHQIRDLCGGVLLRSGPHLVTFGLLRASGARGEGEREITDLTRVHAALTGLAAHAHGRRTERLGGIALDSVAFGVLVLDAGTGALLNLNGPAQRLYEAGVVCSAAGRTRVGSHELVAPLGSALPRALALGPHLRVVVYPEALHGEGRACVVHVHHGPSLARERARRALQLFALTAREAEVAQALLLGWSTKEIAARHGVALSTLRSQVRALLAKTGSDRLATLHALLTGL